MVVRFYFLGVFDLRCDQQALLKPPTQKSQSLLAYLVLQRKRPQLREHLIDLFWGERLEHKGRRSLTTALWHLRSCLPADDFIISDYASVQFNPQAAVWVDVDEFYQLVNANEPESLARALNLYRGTLLTGFYDDWVINERYRLEAEYEEALARLMFSQQSSGQYRQALQTAQRLLQHDPLREDACQVAIRACGQLGQPGAALKEYQRLRQVLQQELGIDPAIETRELYLEVRAASPAGEVAYPIPLEEIPKAGRLTLGNHPLETAGTVRMVGRELELESLEKCWQTARSGHGRFILISGEAGVGKSRLVEEFSKQKRWQGVQVLYGRCYEFERMLPYQPVVDALRNTLLNFSQAELESLPDWVVRELVRLVPELAECTSRATLQAQESREQEQNQLFAAILALIVVLGRRGGLLLVVEDLHWASEATLQLLHYLVRNLAETEVMIVGTSRLEESHERQPALEMGEQLEKAGLAMPIQLASLRQNEIEQLVIEMSGGAADSLRLAQWLYQETEGNPFFLMESVKALFEGGMLCMEEGVWKGDFQLVQAWTPIIPPNISLLILNRLRRLDDVSLELLYMAAVIGREFDFDLLCTVQAQGEDTTLTALDQLLRSRLIEEGRQPIEPDYVFAHHKIQEVAYQTIPPRRKSKMHALVAQTLEQMYPRQSARINAELAFHYLHACQQNRNYVEKAVAYSIAAGDQARILYAHQEAIDHYRRALSLLEEERDYERAARTLMKSASAYHNAFDFKGAQQALDEAFKMWKRSANQPDVHPISTGSKLLRLPWQDPLSLDPAKAFTVSAWGIAKQLFSRLVAFGPDKEIIPDVARTWHVMEDGRKYVFHLRDDVHWSDGTRLTAEDFEYAWKRLLAPATGWIHASLMYDIKGGRAFHQGETSNSGGVGVVAQDETTLVVELEVPAAYFLSLLGYVCPVPRHIVEKLGDHWADPENILTNGAFLVKDCRRSQAISLVRNPAYHGIWRGNIQEVHLNIVSAQDWSLLLQLYQEGALDALELNTFPPKVINDIRTRYAGEYLSGPDLLSDNLGFDTSRPPFNDRRVRLAFALAIDRENMVESLFHNNALVANGGFVPPGMPGHSSNIGLPYDPAQARRLLAEAGYPGGHGFPKVDTLYLDNPYRNPIGEHLRQQWLEILGIDSTWQATGLEEYVNRILNHPPHISSMTWIAEYHTDPDDFLKVGMSHARYFTKWENKRYDVIVEKAGRLTDQDERLKLYAKAEKILIEEVALFPLMYGQIELLVKPSMKKFSISHLSDWAFNDIWVERTPSEPGE